MSGQTAQFLAMIIGLAFLLLAVGMIIFLLKANKKDAYVASAIPLANARLRQPEPEVKESVLEESSNPDSSAPPQFSFEAAAKPRNTPAEGAQRATATVQPSRRALRASRAQQAPVADQTSFFDDSDDDEDFDLGKIGRGGN
jgi:hypothetical protein